MATMQELKDMNLTNHHLIGKLKVNTFLEVGWALGPVVVSNLGSDQFMDDLILGAEVEDRDRTERRRKRMEMMRILDQGGA